MDMNGWNFKNSGNMILITDEKGNNHKATIISNGSVLIEKQGTTRFLRYPKFVINYVGEHFGKEVINKSR